MHKYIIKLVSIVMLLLLISCATTQMGSSSFLNDLVEIAGYAAAGETEKIGKVVKERVTSEIAYSGLKEVLKKANIAGSDHFVDALRLYIEKKDKPKAIASFLKGLEASGVKEMQDIIKVFHTAAVTVRLASPEVGEEFQKFVDYITQETSSYRGVAEMEAQGPPIEFSSPEKTWKSFIDGISGGNWEPVAKSLVGYVPEGVNLNLAEDREEVKEFKNDIEKERSKIASAEFKVGKTEHIRKDLRAVEISVSAAKGKETFWALFQERKEAWKLVGLVEDIALLKSPK